MKKKAGRGRRPARTSRKRKRSSLRAAIANGRKQAREVLDYRKEQRRGRARALRSLGLRRAAIRPVPPPPASVLRTLGPRVSAGVLLAEGDSWFDYPWHDILSLLEDRFLYDVESVAHYGDRMEEMAYGGGQFEELARRLEKLIPDPHRVPRAILLSGGGNDLAGSEFEVLLNHAASSLPPLNDDIITGVIDQRLRDAYANVLSGVTAIAMEYLHRPIPIITHGYDYPVPDGRGFLGGGIFPGPWLEPGFRKKGFEDLAVNIGHMRTVIDRFNSMLAGVSATPAFKHVHYLDLRGTLQPKPYKDYWANELHPTKRGFGMVTEKFARLITTL